MTAREILRRSISRAVVQLLSEAIEDPAAARHREMEA